MLGQGSNDFLVFDSAVNPGHNFRRWVFYGGEHTMTEPVNPEAADAIRIADKHLAGEPPERRKALAQDIVRAISSHAEAMAIDAIRTVTAKSRH